MFEGTVLPHAAPVLCLVLPVALKKVREAEQREALKFRALASNLHL